MFWLKPNSRKKIKKSQILVVKRQLVTERSRNDYNEKNNKNDDFAPEDGHNSSGGKTAGAKL